MAQRVVLSSEGKVQFLERAILALLSLLLVLWIGCASITRVDAGHLGVRVKLAGSARGVQDMGWVFFHPLTEQIEPERKERLDELLAALGPALAPPASSTKPAASAAP